MLIEKEFDKPYPESPECEVNERDCEFNVDAVCHDCGRLLCDSCAIGIRHQPQLVKYKYTSDGETERTQLHCPDCLNEHDLNYQIVGAGSGSLALGLLLLITTGGSSIVLALLALLLLVGGALVLRNEYRLKERINDSYTLADLV
ncbi:hypothetical protein JCM30237_05530 [Halolamina litorea]|uniref:B box-type domain-containing protein n=1 Tax=Halolamina litorea TaxID=1515593 RepID=A0ABD6BQM5_9EURY|nr:hypothetical protein [Halolamina litorea]